MERWIEIKEFKGYEVSNKGNVKSLNYKNTGKERLLKLHQHSTGYTKTTLYKGKGHTPRVSRLVASAFLGLDINDTSIQVDHVNGDKTNNTVENLRLCTASENLGYRYQLAGRELPSNIYKKGDYYQVSIKRGSGKDKCILYFGRYKTVAEAVEVRDKELAGILHFMQLYPLDNGDVTV